MSIRTALATCANMVEGVHCSPYYRQTIKAGDAFVRLAGTEKPDAFGTIDTWQVLVVLPQDYAAAEKRMEVLVPALMHELGTEMTVRRASPQEVVFDAGKVPCVVIEGTRESG